MVWGWCRERHAGTHMEWLSLYLDGSVAMVASVRTRKLGVLFDLRGRNADDATTRNVLGIARRVKSID